MQSTERSTRSSKRYVADPAPDHELPSAPSDTGQYICIECSETFDDKLELNSHRQSHVTKKQFTCSHCGRGFHHQVFLQMHERSHEDGISRTFLTKTSASRVISTRSSKSSQEADIIHVTPTPGKSLYHLNSKVEFKREWKVSQDVTPRECVTRRTQGTSPVRQATVSSDKTQFELRISKLSDSTVHLIDPYGNTLEILADVFNSYTIGEPEEESGSPTGDSRISEISATPTSSTVHLNVADEITDMSAYPQDLGVVSSPQAEVSEPHDAMDDGAVEEDLPLCGIQSVSSAGISPKNVADLGDDAEDVLPPPTSRESDRRDVPCSEHIVSQPATVIPMNSTERKEILPRSVKDSISCDDQTATEGPEVGDLSACNNELAAVAAEDPSLELSTPDDPSSVELESSEVLGGCHLQTEDSISQPLSIEPPIPIDSQEKDCSVLSLTPGKESEKSPSLNVATSAGEADRSLDPSEDSPQLFTSREEDSQDLKSSHVRSLLDAVIENNILSEESAPGGSDLEEDEQLSREEEPFTGPDKRRDQTLGDDGAVLETPLILDEYPKESVTVSSTTDPGSLGHKCDLQTDLSAANKVCNTPVDNAEDDHDENQTTSKRELESGLSETDICRLSQGVHDEAPCPPHPVDVVCSSEPNSRNISSPVMSLDVPDQQSVSPSEGTPLKGGIGEKVLISLEKQASQPIMMPDTLAQIASDTIPILQEAQSPPEQCPEPTKEDGLTPYNGTDLLTCGPTQSNDGSSELNPDHDPGMSSLLHDIKPQGSSDLEQDVNLRDGKEMKASVSSSDGGDICSSENEGKRGGQTQVEVSEVTPVELLSLINLEKTVDESSSHADIQSSVHISKCDDVERITSFKKIPVVRSGEDNLISLPEPEAVSAEDRLLPHCNEDLSVRNYTQSPDVSFNVQTLVSIASAYVKAQERVLSQETEPTEQDAPASMKSDEKLIENSDLKDEPLLEKLEGGDSGTTLCLLEQALNLSPDLPNLSEKCVLSSDDVKDLAGSDIDKNLPCEDPHKQYIQMSNADLTENDLAEDFVDPGTMLLHAPSLEEATKEDHVSAVSVDAEGAVHELSDILSPELQENDSTEGLDDKHVGFGGQCLKCGRRVRRGRKELVWFPICYKCRLKAKREERHAGEGTCHSPDFVLETNSDRKKGSSDFSTFHIKQETEPAQDDTFYRDVKPVQGMHSIKQESAAPLRKMYKCPKCEKSFRIPALLAGHMKCHALPQCVTCGCPMTLKYKTKRLPKRCHKCFQKIKQQKEEERALGGEDDSLDSDSGSLFVDEADLQSLTDNEAESDSILSATKLVEDLKPGSERGAEPFHSIFMRKRKKMNPALQALYCTCDVVLKSGARQPKICKNCQKPVRDRLLTLPKANLIAARHVRGQTAGAKRTQLKKAKKPPPESGQQSVLPGESVSCDSEFSPDDEEIEPFTELDISDQMVPADGEKPRLCPQCGKIFKCNRSLNLHLLSHTATQCESCGCRLQKKKRAGRWSKKCRVCRLLTKGLPDGATEEVVTSEKIPKEKNGASLRMKMKQSKIVRSRKIKSIAKHKKDLKWMNMILAVKGLTRKPRKKKEASVKSSSGEKAGHSSETAQTNVYPGIKDKASVLKDLATPPRCNPGSSGLLVSQKKILGGIPKVNRKCMYREKNIIKVEEQPLPPYVADPSTTSVLVKEEEENQCLECNEVFPSFDLLLGHQQGHVEGQAFTCPQCPQSFSSEQYLSVHISAHAEGPPFRCPECNKTFTRRNHLGVHRRVHTGSRPFACPDCPCRFRQKGSLIIHRYTHRNLQLMLLKPYQCSICNKSFKQKERLVIHERLHTGECPFSCKDCDKVFPSKSRLYVHRKMHKVPEASSSVEQNASCKEESGGQPYQCKACDKICSTKASFVLHCKVHKSSTIFDQSGSRKENLEDTTNEMPLVSEQELNIKTEPEGHPFSCKDCNKVCSTKASFVLHRKVHGLDQRSDVGSPFVCKDCGKVCSTKASLVLHRKVHKSPLMSGLKANIGEPPYICQDCGKVCSTKASFVLHCKVHKTLSSSDQILKTNMQQKSFVCKDCGFVCSTKASFVLHRKVHRSSPSLVQNLKDGTGEHPFTCKECDKVCSTKASFVLHCKVHKAIPASDQSLIPQADVEEKPYHCKDCGKIYSTKGRLLSHVKLHTGQDASADRQPLKIDTEEKPFACPICHMRFTRLKILVRHKLIHGEDVFRCGHCGKRFLFQKSLMNHVPVCLKRSKGKSLQGKEKVPKKRSRDGGNNDESTPKRRKNETKKAAPAVQKLKKKKFIKAKKLAVNKEKSKAKSSAEKKPRKTKREAELDPECEGENPSDGKPERLLETVSKEKEIGKDKKPKDVGKVKKVLKKVPRKRQKVGGEGLKKWRILAAATVKKRKLQAVISGGKKKVTVKKKGPSKAKSGGKNSKE